MTASDDVEDRVPLSRRLSALWPLSTERLKFGEVLTSLGFTEEDISGPGKRLLEMAGGCFNAADTWHDWPDGQLAEALSELEDRVTWLRAFTAGEEWARIIPRRRARKKGTSATQMYLRNVRYSPQAKARAERFGPKLDGTPLHDGRLRSELNRALKHRQASLEGVRMELERFEAAITDLQVGLRVSARGRPGQPPDLVRLVHDAALFWKHRHGRFPPTKPGRPKSRQRARFEMLLRALEAAHLRRVDLTTPVVNAGIRSAKNQSQKV